MFGGGWDKIMKGLEARMDRREFLVRGGRCVMACGLALATGMSLEPLLGGAVRAQNLERGLLGRKLSPFFTPLDGQRIRCSLCPRECEVPAGERGYCRVRQNIEGSYYSLAYGNPCAVHVDPIEKKPFYHVLPGTLSFSIATAGCNLHCKFCQNWEISQARPDDTLNYSLSPEQVVQAASQNRCASIASTYVEPTVFMEYMIDIGKFASERKILKVIHSNGYVNPEPLRLLGKVLAAACIDLKGFKDDYYRDMSEGTLEPVLSSLKQLKQAGIHTEIVNLVVPTRNDDPGMIRSMCQWIKNNLGPDTPLHFTRFQPLYRLKSLSPTPVGTLEQAWKIALDEGLRFAYIGNVPGHPAEHTHCPECKTRLIERTGYKVQLVGLKDGACGKCGQKIPGIWKT